MLPVNIPKDINKYFYNRKKDIKQISLYTDALYDDISSQLLIMGQRGVGKTFLIKKIINDQKEDIRSVYLDIRKIRSENRSNINECIFLKELMNELFNLIAEDDKILKVLLNLFSQLKIKDIDLYNTKAISKIPIFKIKENYNKLSKFVMSLPQNIVDNSNNIRGIIIVIDEFQDLKDVEDPEDLFWLFRSYIQMQSNVCYIFTGSVSSTADVIQMINGPLGAFGGRMIQINIDAFSKEQTLNYIHEKANHIEFTDDGFDEFFKCTKGIPTYINPFCNILKPDILYDGKLINEIFTTQIDQIVIMWLYVWGRLDDTEKDLIKLFVENNVLLLKEIDELLPNSKTTIIKYLDYLSMKGIVKYTPEGYMLTDEVLKMWLIHKKETEGHYPY